MLIWLGNENEYKTTPPSNLSFLYRWGYIGHFNSLIYVYKLYVSQHSTSLPIQHQIYHQLPWSFSKPNDASPNQFVCILVFFHIPSSDDSSLSHFSTLLATHHFCHYSNKRDWSFRYAQIQRICGSWSL